MIDLEIGHDIVSVARIRKAVERQGRSFLQKIFTVAELLYLQKFKNPFPHYAGRFAAKEALAKALGTGFGKELDWQDIEILPDDRGKPILHPSDRLQKQSGGGVFRLSISHDDTYASATVIFLRVPTKSDH